MSEAGRVPNFVLDWARQSGPDAVLGEVRSRLEQRRLGVRAIIHVPLGPEQRRAVGRLLDATWAPSSAGVSVRALRSGLLEHGCTLEDLLAAVDDRPLRDRPAERKEQDRRSAQQRTEALTQLRELLGLQLPAPTRELAEAALDRWVLRRYPPLERASAVGQLVAALPAGGEGILLSVLAAKVARDAHALDRSRPLGRAVARFLAVRAAFTDAVSLDIPMIGWVDPGSSAEAWRAAWATGGVACDAVSSQVLVLNLPLTGDAAAVRLSRAAGSEPLWLSLRSLSGNVALERPMDVFVCENPSILESAADRLGERSAALICTFGRPGLAAIQVLRAIAGSARLRIRADGDAAGWGIVGSLTAAFPTATPWRMPPGTTAYEEELLDLLLGDLDRGSSPAGRTGEC